MHHAEPLTPAAARVLDQLEMWGQKLGLERITELLEALDRPQDTFPIVLVAGTNGKGSTAVQLAAIAHAAGVHTGLFTSPHLQSVRERIRVGGSAVSAADLSTALEALGAASRPTELPSYFEAVTAAALLHFRDSAVDLAILEVGLGGRLDATNATEPILSIITPIGHDHQEHLGHRLDQIAREKVGVGRVSKPLIAWAKGQHGVQRVLQDCAQRGVLVEEAWRHLSIKQSGDNERCFEIDSHAEPPSNGGRRYDVRISLPGGHQSINAALALRAAERLSTLGFNSIDRDAIESGLAACRWPGRLETVQIPLSLATHPVTLDGAHNLAGIRSLTRHLDQRISAGEAAPDLIFASLKGKRATPSLRHLSEQVEQIWLSSPTSNRALPAQQLHDTLGQRDPRLAARCQLRPAFGDAMAAAIEARENSERPRPLLICGSLYAVGEARTWLHEQFGTPLPAADLNLFQTKASPAD